MITQEGGPTLAGYVHRVIGYVAPVLLGPGPTALADAGVMSITQAVRPRIEDATMVGPDLRISAVPTKEG